jgi:hypothetical protein
VHGERLIDEALRLVLEIDGEADLRGNDLESANDGQAF